MSSFSKLSNRHPSFEKIMISLIILKRILIENQFTYNFVNIMFYNVLNFFADAVTFLAGNIDTVDVNFHGTIKRSHFLFQGYK